MYQRIVQLIDEGIGRGALAPGHRLPAERELARALNVARATVVSAYRELEARGLVRGQVGRGTFVAAQPDSGMPFAWRGKISTAAIESTDSTLREIMRRASDTGIVSLAAGAPALDLFPADAFQSATEYVLGRDAASAWGHAPTEGLLSVRETFAGRFGGDPDEVLVVAGAQQGLELLTRCLIDRGDAVIVDRPGYLGALQSFRTAGARIVGWDFLRANIDELEDLILRYRPKLLYTNPTFQNPTGVTLPVRARRELIDLARRYRLPIVEDETYRELSFGAAVPPSLYALDEDSSVVIRVNSFSKVLAPGLRLGWITAPRTIIDQLATMKQQSDPHTQNLVQLVVARLIEVGVFDRHIGLLRTEHRRRRDHMIKQLSAAVPPGSLRFIVPEGGLFLWCRLRQSITAAAVQAHALSRGVFLLTGEPFYRDGGGTHELRLCFTTVLPAVATKASAVIAEAVRHCSGAEEPRLQRVV
jgi:DNA-binding transcriptional MocR family regulator